MKRFLTILIVAFSMLFTVSCGSTKNTEEITFGTQMLVIYTMDVTQHQLDSICTVDTLPNYDTWIKARFTDYETNTVFVKRMCFKKTPEYDEVLYILVGDNEPYKITKRITD